MNYTLLGLNHKTAPIEVREKFAISEARLPHALQALRSMEGVEEAFIISTCNRVELLARSADRHVDLRKYVESQFNIAPAQVAQSIYEYRDEAAVRHLFEVASSLDSLVVGEPQILGQVKEAYAAARSLGCVHSHLDLALTRAFAVAKRVRTETHIGTSAVSVASVAVDLAKKIFGSLEGKKVFIVGAGKMAELAARHLTAQGVHDFFITNRTDERAADLVQRLGGHVVPFAQMLDRISEADIVITSTGAQEPIFRREHAQRFARERRNKPMFFIDIAVPRDVDSAVNKVDGMFVYSVDDLQSVVATNRGDREREAAKARDIIDSEVRRFFERMQSLSVVPTIVSLQEQMETIRQAEIEKVRGRLGTLTAEQELAIDAMTKGILNKVLHAPITELKSAAQKGSGTPEFTTLLDAVRKIFNLRVSESVTPENLDSAPETNPKNKDKESVRR